MAKNCSAKISSNNAATLSGPHICSQVGQEILSVAKSALLETSSRSNGVMTSAEIEKIFDLLVSTPEVFSLYTRNFNACADIHKNRSFAKINATSLSRFIMQSYCKNVVRQVFVHQIAHSNAQWVGHFLDGFLVHVKEKTDPQFTNKIFARYRALSLRKGAKLELPSIIKDDKLQIIVGKLFDELKSEPDSHQALGITINRHIGEVLQISGPSPLKVVNQDLNDFFNLLVLGGDTSQFRLGANAQPSVNN